MTLGVVGMATYDTSCSCCVVVSVPSPRRVFAFALRVSARALLELGSNALSMPSRASPAPATADDATAAHNDFVGSVDRRGLAVRTGGDLEEAVLEVLLRVATNIPAGPRGVDDAVEGLGGAAAPEVEVLLLVV
eukprot:CAMPEP_0119491290 /NCGR_PEP_ID=MMETSP1344-20130328/16210_1 /TAXON_ID=236787 /ORGANISM="Florenciella parvula, Strain CCMP2471" /LENGTH=133 /DNA_ID=CAMNT_0007526533 /DNA_START=120 /DNA_END=519 /DNA_ORIENTATION=+